MDNINLPTIPPIPYPSHSSTTEDQAHANCVAYDLREIAIMQRLRCIVDCLNGLGTSAMAKEAALETVLEMARGRCR